MIINQEKNINFINERWEKSIIPTLMEYIRIPNKSPQFDPHWKSHGYMDQAVTLIAAWCENQALPGMKLDVISLEERTPVIFIEIPGQLDHTILLYGHLDKQPEMTGWDPNLGPWQPVQREDFLYGRGAADDGYAVFASLTAIQSLQQQGLSHGRCIILIEACEESGSTDLPYYIENLKNRIGNPSLVICLDSGCGNYEQFWVTTSLRGLVSGYLQINTLSQGIHSGVGSGIAPSCFRIARQLLHRIEDEKTGNIILPELYVEIPPARLEQAHQASHILGHAVFQDLPFLEKVEPESFSIPELILRQTWKPALSIIGCDGIPIIENAGNVTLPSLTLKLSIRLPPTCDAHQAGLILKNKLEIDPPHGANIRFELQEKASGWNAPKEETWLTEAMNEASLSYFGKEAAYLGEGGSIPFMGLLGKQFPKAQFVITGVLGPASNAHGPNEFLHIPMGKKLTACIAHIITKHPTHRRQ
jgi:acetylornithine deacetylase/succinyl-diaminopimelate desuccinylase-like protein